jgi:glycerophosphoryl diester phosphodiesterase
LGSDTDPAQLRAEGWTGIDYHFGVLMPETPVELLNENGIDAPHPEWVAGAHEQGMSVNVWTVDDAGIGARMNSLGVDLMTTNEPLLFTAQR